MKINSRLYSKLYLMHNELKVACFIVNPGLNFYTKCKLIGSKCFLI